METWPITLPQEFDVGSFDVNPANNMIRTEVDAGIPKRRKRFTKGVQTIEGKMVMTIDQLQILKSFREVSLNGGVDQFIFPRPGYCTGTIVVSFKTDESKSHLGSYLFEVSLSFETLDDYLE